MSPSVPKPHDALFRGVFSQASEATGLFRCTLPPELVHAIDWSGLAPVSPDFVDGSLADRRADTVFVAGLRSGQPLRIYFLLEHRSHRGTDAEVKLERYGSLIFEWHRQQEPAIPAAVIPVVVHHGPRPWRPLRGRSWRKRMAKEQPFPEALAPFLCGARIQLLGLARMDEAELLALPVSPVAKLTFLCLQILQRRDRHAAEFGMRRWSDLLAGAGELDYNVRLLSSYVLETVKLSEVRLRNLFRDLIGPLAEVTVMSTAERIRREALRKGLEQGIEQGKVRGQANLLLRILAAKFGAVSQEMEERVRSGSIEDLDRWAVAAVRATELDEVFEE